jgi:hypothetical protein
MAQKPVSRAAGVISGAVLLLSVAAVFLIQNFGSVGVGRTWPAIVAAAGLCLTLVGYLELGLGLAGVFGIWLIANLGVIAPVGKSWPIFLIWMVIMLVVGFMRSRSSRAS